MDKLNKDNMVFEVYEPQGTYNGARYFSYKGEVLDDIRTRIEKSND